MKRCLFLFFLCAAFLNSDEILVDLRNPTFKNGTLSTQEGGVIKTQDIRIQARKIRYIKKPEGEIPIHRVEAEGDLMIQYKGRVFVGREFEYDFIKKIGTVYEGKTFSSMWYVGGDEIQLNADGSYRVKRAFITTCENKDSSWDLHAGRVEVLKNELFEAKNVRLRLFKIPTFWLPSFKLNLKKFKEPLFRYGVNWDKGQGPRATCRYQLYSWQDFALYGRIEYRWRTGWGGAFETEYFPEHKRTTFTTRSYLGTDRLENAPDKMRRYRLQGAFHSSSENRKTNATLSWDKYSDVRMPGDFKSDDFEVNTAKRTILYVHHREEALLSSLKIRPRFNVFESIKQDLPTLYAALHPMSLGSTGVISMNSLKVSYLDFVYSDQLTESLAPFQSMRVELSEKLYRPFQIGAMTFTPHIGGLAIFYSQSPSSQAKTLGLIESGARVNFRAIRQFSHYKHILEPFLHYNALTRPTVSPHDHYIFSIQDGYQKIQQIEWGVRNLLFSKKRPGAPASFAADLYADAFFSDPVIPQAIPRLYLKLGWELPSLHFSLHNCWNFRHELFDFCNLRTKWTINENAALTFEARYRSKFDWRKADHENFILDVTRSERELLLSPLSDQRVTLLANLFIRLTPFWECHLQAHQGFYRLTEKPYYEMKADLYTWISAAWKLRLSFSKTDHGRFRVTAGISLVKK